MERVFVTAMDTINALGTSAQEMWQGLLAGKSGIGQVNHFDTSWMPVHIAAEVKDFNKLNYLSSKEKKILYPASRLALSYARSTLKQAGLLNKQGFSHDPLIPFFIGTAQGDSVGHFQQYLMTWTQHDEKLSQKMMRSLVNDNIGYGLLNTISQGCGLYGMQSINTNACASSGYAIACGIEHIRQGLSDKVLCGGVDATSPLIYLAFCSLRSLAPEKCQPFDQNRQGVVMGEGCGMMLLESETSLKKRSQQPLAEVLGYGWSNDGYHLARPHPEGLGVKHALRQVICDAKVKAGDIDCIFAHGTGTVANDVIEAQAFSEVFEEKVPPVTAPKSSIGHAMGAASIIEAIIAVMSLNHQLIPPTINHEKTDPDCPIDVVAQKPRSQKLNMVLTNSSGFGGSNHSLIFKSVVHKD